MLDRSEKLFRVSTHRVAETALIMFCWWGIACSRSSRVHEQSSQHGDRPVEIGLYLPTSGDAWSVVTRTRPDCVEHLECMRREFESWEQEIALRLGAREGGGLVHIFLSTDNSLVFDFEASLFSGKWSIFRESIWVSSLIETVFVNHPDVRQLIFLENGQPTVGQGGHIFLAQPFIRTGMESHITPAGGE